MVDQEIQVSDGAKDTRRSSKYIKNRIDAIVGEKAEKITEIFEKMLSHKALENESFQRMISHSSKNLLRKTSSRLTQPGRLKGDLNFN
jgi:hypothetical protein